MGQEPQFTPSHPHQPLAGREVKVLIWPRSVLAVAQSLGVAGCSSRTLRYCWKHEGCLLEKGLFYKGTFIRLLPGLCAIQNLTEKDFNILTAFELAYPTGCTSTIHTE